MMATGDLHGHESEPVKLIEVWKNWSLTLINNNKKSVYDIQNS